jgi:hypothetical protein
MLYIEMVKKPGGDDNYFVRVIVIFISIVIMLCYLIYFLKTSGVIDGLTH